MSIRIDHVPEAPLSDEVIALRDGSLTRQQTGDLANQLAATGAVASAIAARADQSTVDALETRLTAQEQAAVTGVVYLDEPVAAWSDADVVLSGLPVIDGVTLFEGDLVGLGGQTDASQNGVWRIAAGAWTRSPGMDVSGEANLRAVTVSGGSTYAGSTFQFLVTDPGTFVIGSDAISTKLIASGAGFATGAEFATLNGRVDLLEEGTGADAYDLGADLELAQDADGNLFRRTDADGLVHLPQLGRSVQDEVAFRPSQLGAATPEGAIEELRDGANAIVRRTDKRGMVYLPGTGSGVQHGLRVALDDQGRSKAPLRSSRDILPASVTAIIAGLQAQALPFIEPPALLVPNGYDMPDTVLAAITIADDNPVAQLPFPYRLGGAVHPYILPVRQPLYGYRYLMSESNHANGSSAEETPVLFGTNDLEHFDLIPDVVQPMLPAQQGTDGLAWNSFPSDPWLAWDPTDGALIWATRDTTVHPAAAQEMVMTKTWDGVHWTDLQRQPMPGGAGVAPSMLYDIATNQWSLWFISVEGVLDRYTAPDWLGPWTFQSSTNMNTVHGVTIWHGEVKRIGDRYALCCNARDNGTDGNAQVYLGFSSDGDTWVMSGGLVSPQPSDIYKPSFFPEFDGTDLVRFTFVWSHWDSINMTPADNMQIHVQRSAWIDLSTL